MGLRREASATAVETSSQLSPYMITAAQIAKTTDMFEIALWAETPARPRKRAAARIDRYACPALNNSDSPTAPTGGVSLVARTFRDARRATSTACVTATIAAACQAGSRSTLAKKTALETLTF